MPAASQVTLTATVPVAVPTGFPLLDAALGGGWPAGVLTELLVPDSDFTCWSAEFSLLSPALARLTVAPEASWVVLIAPPWIPYAPGLCWQGLTVSRVLVVRAREPLEVLWAMEETLRSGAGVGVIAWAGLAGRSLLQRLHLLAGQRQIWSVLVRAARFRMERSPARLRLQLLRQSSSELQIEIFKNGWHGATRQGTGMLTLERRI